MIHDLTLYPASEVSAVPWKGCAHANILALVTDLTPQRPDGLFSSAQVDELIGVLERVRATALPA